jgi:hypothetical protein
MKGIIVSFLFFWVLIILIGFAGVGAMYFIDPVGRTFDAVGFIFASMALAILYTFFHMKYLGKQGRASDTKIKENENDDKRNFFR